MILHYLAYGSNLHPFRLHRRVPSAKLIGVAPMPGREVNFHKQSKSGSGKCNLAMAGNEKTAWGALYEFSAADQPNLDKVEGAGKGYIIQQLQLTISGVIYNPLVYVATHTHINPTLTPFTWYKDIVVEGARFHKFPAQYVAELDAVTSIPDTDLKCTREHEELLLSMKNYTSSMHGIAQPINTQPSI